MKWKNEDHNYTYIYISSIVKRASLLYVNQVWIRSWNQPVLRDEGSFFQGKNRAFGGVQTHAWVYQLIIYVSTKYIDEDTSNISLSRILSISNILTKS